MRASIAAAAALLGAVPAYAQQITVGRAVQVSAPLGEEPHFEMLLAAHPTDPSQLMACSMLFRRDLKEHETVTYMSSDRGRTWRKTLEVRSPRGQENWDPACLYGPDGTAWSISEGYDTSRTPHVRLDRSTDGGATWLPPRIVPHFERAYLTIDGTAGPHRGRLYIHGNEGYHTSGGKREYAAGMGVHVLDSVGGPARTEVIASAGDKYAVTTGPGAVLSDGTFVGVFTEFNNYYQPDGSSLTPRYELGPGGAGRPNGAVKVLRTEKGRFVASTVSDEYTTWPGWASSPTAYLAADTSAGPFRDRIYIVWNDERSGRSEILLSYSTDRGKTWSAPRIVNDDRARAGGAGGPDDFHPAVVVNRHGVVGVVWNDRRDQSDNLSYSVRFATSFDGGETFTPSVRVSPEPHVPGRPARWALQTMSLPRAGGGARHFIGLHSFNFSGGHTRGLAADAGGNFHALWVSNVTGVAQLWTVRITAAGRAERNGGGRLAELKDVSGQVGLVFTGLELTHATGAVQAELALENSGTDTLRAPLVLRVHDLRSAFGVPAIRNADNGVSGAGAIYDFTELVDGGRLVPGAKTRTKTLRFTVAELDSLTPRGEAISRLIQMRSAVFAPEKQ